MANINRANGFRLSKLHNKAWLGMEHMYYSPGTTILGLGDPVVRAAGGSYSDSKGQAAAVVRATTGSYVTGVIVGFQPNYNTLVECGYRLANETGYIYLCDDPDAVFEVQEGGSGSALTTANIGNTINSITAVNADTTIGSSLFQIDNATATTADTGTWMIVGLVQRADNAVGQYAKWLVKPNLHTEAVAGAANILSM